ncbi:site-2 protease family protein [Collinsella ihumii]|uniref:Site-2 protease family protein n=1 Tax=Collinsella ihumii TaxID=1720204 RepID=A0ABT7XGL3_9ACTN|nr:site-2 protease family protein [Collinsella ihumii]MBM6905899.1 site-2 protease family protein [Collinsella tanakaei]MDN0054418.1 site-2 protease family protein [Collinsella ihumii]MDN0064548.1 site-2 protease family protein [Collinsella ihumii]
MLNLNYIFYLLTSAAALIIGIVIHESAHALAAYLLGDRTARSRGRISLNPLNHIDPFGTVLLPLIMLVAGGPIFAFAKPVPVYLGNLKNPKRDEVAVALAGPVSNVLLAGVGAVLLRLVVSNGDAVIGFMGENVLYLTNFLTTFMSVNLSLAFFNLIPLPPLDGSSILVLFLRGRALQTYYRIQQYAMPILLIVLYVLPTVLNIDLVSMYFRLTLYPVYDLLLSFALGA